MVQHFPEASHFILPKSEEPWLILGFLSASQMEIRDCRRVTLSVTHDDSSLLVNGLGKSPTKHSSNCGVGGISKHSLTAILTILFDIWYQSPMHAYFMHKSHLVFYGNSERELELLLMLSNLKWGFLSHSLFMFSGTLLFHLIHAILLWKLATKWKKNHPQKTADMGSSGNGIQIPGLIR